MTHYYLSIKPIWYPFTVREPTPEECAAEHKKAQSVERIYLPDYPFPVDDDSDILDDDLEAKIEHSERSS